jgi:hypothetical protein
LDILYLLFFNQLLRKGSSEYLNVSLTKVTMEHVKDCNIPVAKRVAYRLAKSFGDPSKGPDPKKGSAEDVQEKMKTFMRVRKKPSSPLETQAIRELILANV